MFLLEDFSSLFESAANTETSYLKICLFFKQNNENIKYKILLEFDKMWVEISIVIRFIKSMITWVQCEVIIVVVIYPFSTIMREEL